MNQIVETVHLLLSIILSLAAAIVNEKGLSSNDMRTVKIYLRVRSFYVCGFFVDFVLTRFFQCGRPVYILDHCKPTVLSSLVMILVLWTILEILLTCLKRIYEGIIDGKYGIFGISDRLLQEQSSFGIDPNSPPAIPVSYTHLTLPTIYSV
eukprot:TRINITY_DN14802_c0_g1_i1.p1 TRINITY_DN14802_c0_g1~~TRINITY_DN14802_c0_g1_i1.p1  ORF type:complete len:151 (+),score=6.66 TRINITY_DN14802_c0_g1_i1:286-738(+)